MKRSRQRDNELADKLPLIVPKMALQKLPKSELLDSWGVTPQYLINEWMKVANQDDDLTNKRKTLEPLMKEVGLHVNGDQPGGITNNIIVMPAEITKKFKLGSPIIEGDIIDVPPIKEHV